MQRIITVAASLILLLGTVAVVAEATVGSGPRGRSPRAPAPLLQEATAEERAGLELRLRQAGRKLQQGDTVGALFDVEAVLSADDRFWKAYWVRGQIQARMGDDLGAWESLRRAAELDPGNPQLHYLVAGLAFQLADFPAVGSQLLAAAQAGHDPEPLRQLASELQDRAGIAVDLRSALDAPRIAVELLFAEPDRGLEELGLELRTLLLEQEELGLVKEVSVAAWVVHLHRQEGDSGADGVLATLVDPEGEPALEHALPGTGAESRLQLSEIVGEIVEQIRE